MPETVQSTETGQPVVTEQSTPQPSTSPREAVYAKYYSQQPQDSPAAAAATPSGADGSQATQTPDPAAQAATPDGATPATPAPQPDVNAQLLEQIQALQARIDAMAKPAPAPVEQPAAAAAPEPSWIDKLREGKIEEAEEILIKKAADRIMKPTIDAAAERSREIARAEAAVEKIIDRVRNENADLQPFEPFIIGTVEQAMNRLRLEGKLTSTEEVVRQYEKSLVDAVGTARKIAQSYRGAGKQEAMTSKQEVLSASTVTPNAVDTSRQQAGEPAKDPEPETVQDYFAKRRALENKQKQLVTQ